MMSLLRSRPCRAGGAKRSDAVRAKGSHSLPPQLLHLLSAVPQAQEPRQRRVRSFGVNTERQRPLALGEWGGGGSTKANTVSGRKAFRGPESGLPSFLSFLGQFQDPLLSLSPPLCPFFKLLCAIACPHPPTQAHKHFFL